MLIIVDFSGSEVVSSRSLVNDFELASHLLTSLHLRLTVEKMQFALWFVQS